MRTETIDYIKYELYDSHAMVCGYDQRKKNQSFIRIPAEVYFEGKRYEVKGFRMTMDGLLKTSVLEIPNTLTQVGYQTADLTDMAGHTEKLPNGQVIKVYEARPTKSHVIKPKSKKKSLKIFLWLLVVAAIGTGIVFII